MVYLAVFRYSETLIYHNSWQHGGEIHRENRYSRASFKKNVVYIGTAMTLIEEMLTITHFVKTNNIHIPHFLNNEEEKSA